MVETRFNVQLYIVKRVDLFWLKGGWSGRSVCDPTFSSWGFGGAVSPQRGPGQSPRGKHILATIY